MNVLKNEHLKLSIVIAAWNGIESLRGCLTSLENQIDETGTEIIVVCNFPFVSEEFSSLPVKFITASDMTTVPKLRQIGVAAAHGEIIALLEDHCFFSSHWCREIKKAHESKYPVIGGSVENAGDSGSLDWAVYFYDYGKYMPPNKRGAANTLSGINVSYKRAVLKEVQETYADGFFETAVNEELKRRGHQLLMMPSMIVYHRKNYETKRAAEHCYHLARHFSARRVAEFTTRKRAFYIGASLALPVLLPARIIVATVKKNRRFGQLFRSLPFLILLMLFWSYGEFRGYSAGAGTSAGEWR